MAKLIKSTDIFETDDIFRGIRDSASKTIDELNKLNGEITETANALKKSIGGANFDSSKSIKEFTDATSKSNKLAMETIKIEELKQKMMQQSERASQELLKTEQQRSKSQQQSQKINQESEKTDQQRIKTKREQAKLERELARETERQNKLTERAKKLADDESSAYKKLVKETRDLKNASKELASQLLILERDGKKNTAEFREMSRQYNETTRSAQQADATLKKIDSRVGDNFRNVGNYTGAISKLSNGLGMLGLSFGIGSIVQTAGKAIIEFDQKIADLSAITGASGADLEFYKQQANELGIGVTGGASAVVEAYKLIGSAKPELLANADALNEVTKSAIILSQASGMELPESATALTDAMNQFGAPAEEASRFINVLANGAKFGSAEIPQVTEALLRFGAVAKTSNVSIEESTALIELLAEKGLKGADAGTALRNVMLKLSAPDALPKKAKEELEALGISFDVLTNESIPFSERLEELKPLLDNNTALVRTFGVENAVAATSILSNTDRLKELDAQMYTSGTATEQANQRTNTLSHALMELKNSFLEMFTSMGSGSGSQQIFIDGLKFIASNLSTILGIITRVVTAYIGYRVVLASIKAYQFIMSGGLKELGQQFLANLNLTKQATKAQKTFGDESLVAGDKVSRAGRAMQAIPWMLIIGLLVELATKWYDIASGSAEARRQADLYNNAKNNFDDSKLGTGLDNETKAIAEKMRLLDLEIRKRKANGEDEKKLDVEKARRMAELTAQSKQSMQNTLNQTKAKRLEQEKELALLKKEGVSWETIDKYARKYNVENTDFMGNHMRGMEKIRTQDLLTNSINNAKIGEQKYAEAINNSSLALDELNVQHLEASAQNEDYSVHVENNSGKIKNNINVQKEYVTQLKIVDDYLEKTIDLMQQLNVIGQDRELLNMDKQIESAINNAVKLVNETGQINVGVEANTTTGAFGDQFDPIEKMLIERAEMEKKFTQQRSQFAIDEMVKQFEREKELAKQKLISERDDLLAQDGIGAKDKEKINKSYNLRLIELKIEQTQQDIDMELQKKLNVEKTANDIVKIEEKKFDEIDKYNEKLLSNQTKYAKDQKIDVKEEADIEIKTAKDKYKTISEFVTASANLFIKQSEKKVAQIDKELEHAEKQFDSLKSLAESGNINAQDSLAEQQRIITEKEKQKAKELKRQERIKLAQSVFSTYASKVDSGSKNPLMETIRDTTLLTQFIASLPTFESGTENTGSNGNGIDGKGGFHAVLHPNERVVPKSLNDRIGSLTNAQLTRVAVEYQSGKLIRDGDSIATPMETALLINKIDELKNVISNKPETNIELGQITQSMMEIVKTTKTGNTTMFNRYKIRK